MRPHIAAVYAFARIADDFADEGDVPPAARLARLDDWQQRLCAAADRKPIDDGTEGAAVFVALAETMRVCALDAAPFLDLLSAFKQDVTVRRYETWADVLDYSRRSANPVGRIVLKVAGSVDASTGRASDAVCTALQLTNFWQDLAGDWGRGRLYVPMAVVRAAGAEPGDLDRRQITPEWRNALADVAARTRRLFADGRAVADGVRGRLRWELRATWLGGVRVLDRLERGGFDVFAHRPALGWRDVTPIVWRAAAWRRASS